MLVQVDVDSTLYDANDLFWKVGVNEFGVQWPREYHFWFGPEDIGTDLETLLAVFRRCHSEEYVSKQVPFEGAADVLAGITEDYPEVEVAYISDRSTELREPLFNWLTNNGFLTNPDQHVEVTNDKRVWMREHRPSIVIDDRIRTMMMARFELGAQVLSIAHPYNINLRNEVDGIHIVPTWGDIDTVLRKTVIPRVRDAAIGCAPEIDLIVR